MAKLSAALKTKCDSVFNAFTSDIAPRQTLYFNGNGRYWQGPWVLPVTPSDGAQAGPNKAVKPTDQAESWNDFGAALPAAIEINLKVDVYDIPTQRLTKISTSTQKIKKTFVHAFGYLITGEVIETGVTYCKVQNVGSGKNDFLAHDWQEVIL